MHPEVPTGILTQPRWPYAPNQVLQGILNLQHAFYRGGGATAETR